jgi:hypothetical protein
VPLEYTPEFPENLLPEPIILVDLAIDHSMDVTFVVMKRLNAIWR